jgi:hypothetical protein
VSAYIEIQQVSRLLATSVLRLNKLAVRCKIDPSLGGGGERGSRRHFSVQDVCRLGLAVWLSNAGLRGPAISNVFGRRATIRLLARLQNLGEIEAEAKHGQFLVAVDYRGRSHGFHKVTLTKSLNRAWRALGEVSGVVVPLGELLGTLAKDVVALTSL